MSHPTRIPFSFCLQNDTNGNGLRAIQAGNTDLMMEETGEVTGGKGGMTPFLPCSNTKWQADAIPDVCSAMDSSNCDVQPGKYLGCAFPAQHLLCDLITRAQLQMLILAILPG